MARVFSSIVALVVTLELGAITLALSGPCNPLQVSQGKIVCVCSAEYCDDFEFDWPSKYGEATLVRTTKSGLRLNVAKIGQDDEHGRLHEGSSNTTAEVKVDLSKERQSILGWGGAFTDAATITIKSLSEKAQENLLRSYFGKKGSRYNFGRVPIAGSDFSTRPYTYDDSTSPDYELKNWSLAQEDLEYKIPMIRRASEYIKSWGQDMKLFGSSWSPPLWMKNNSNIMRGHLINDKRIYESYANYLVKFFKAYAEYGIDFWGATVQNEPFVSIQSTYRFNSLNFDAKEQVNFIANHLGPALVRNGLTRENFKLMVGDDGLGWINKPIPEILSHPDVGKYVAGLAFHWYSSELTAPYSDLDKVYREIRDKIEFVLMTEACSGFKDNDVILGSWERGVDYARDIIEDLSRHSSGWIDWNLALDMNGGPNWAKNFVDSPILVDAKRDLFYKQPMYYALAHFSRFMRAGSVKVDSESDDRNILQVAVYDKKSGHAIIGLLNDSDEPVKLNLLVVDGRGPQVEVDPFVVKAKSINTIIVKVTPELSNGPESRAHRSD